MSTLRGARVWITGASSGIGEALVAPLVQAGARVALTARRAPLLQQLAASHPDGTTLVVPADVTDRAAVRAAVGAIEAAWGGVDLAILNAGGEAPPAEAPGDARPFTDTMTLNYFGVLFGIEAVLPGMLSRGTGHLAAVSSVAGYRALPTSAAYGASKAALNYALDAMRFDLEPRGIRVTVINPGFVQTPLSDRLTFWKPFLMSADAAAARIVSGLARDRREIHFPLALSVTLKALRLLPYPLYAGLVGAATRHTRSSRAGY